MNQETLGRYRLYRRLAAGGMGEVYLAGQKGPGGFEKLVVLKRMLPEMAKEPELVGLFLDEARLMARLSHRNIPPVLDLGEDESGYFAAIEFVRGPTLAHLLEDGPLPPALALDICAELAETLAYAHAERDRDGSALGIIHRDVSPPNILISTTGDVKLIDFGIARSTVQRGLGDAGGLKGKLAYMSPEQSRGEPLDGRSDLFSLGVVLYEMLTGENPFLRPTQFASLIAIQSAEPEMPRLDPWKALCVPVLHKLLAKKREDRFADGLAAQEAILAVRGRMRPGLRLSSYVSKRFGRPLANLLASTRTGALPPLLQAPAELRDVVLESLPETEAMKTSPGVRAKAAEWSSFFPGNPEAAIRLGAHDVLEKPSPGHAHHDEPSVLEELERPGHSERAAPTPTRRRRPSLSAGLVMGLTASALCLMACIALWTGLGQYVGTTWQPASLRTTVTRGFQEIEERKQPSSTPVADELRKLPADPQPSSQP